MLKVIESKKGSTSGNITMYNQSKNIYVDIGYYISHNCIRLYVRTVSGVGIRYKGDVLKEVINGTTISSTIKDFYNLQDAETFIRKSYGITIEF